MGERLDDRQKDLFRRPLERITDLGRPRPQLTEEIGWSFLDGRFGSVCWHGPASRRWRPGRSPG